MQDPAAYSACPKVREQVLVLVQYVQDALEFEQLQDWPSALNNFIQAKLQMTCILDDLVLGMDSAMEPSNSCSDDACMLRLLVDLAPSLIWAYERRAQDLELMQQHAAYGVGPAPVPAALHPAYISTPAHHLSPEEEPRPGSQHQRSSSQGWGQISTPVHQQQPQPHRSSSSGAGEIPDAAAVQMPGTAAWQASTAVHGQQAVDTSALQRLQMRGTAVPTAAGPAAPIVQRLQPQAVLGTGSMVDMDGAMERSAVIQDAIQLCQRPVHGTLDDLSGLESVKQELRQAFFWPRSFPHLFQGFRAPPRNFLFYGPPGTGKTMLVQKVAAEGGLKLLCLSPSMLLSKWSGESEKMLSSVFAAARSLQPCIIFMDEIDSLARARGSGGDDMLSRRLLTELLILMNELTPDSQPPDGTMAAVYVFAATNRIQDCDAALLRRFDRRVHIPLPDAMARASFFQSVLQLPEMASDMKEEELQALIEASDSLSCAELAAVCREACMAPVRELQDTMWAGGAPLAAPTLRKIRLHDFLQALHTCSSVAAQQRDAAALELDQ